MPKPWTVIEQRRAITMLTIMTAKEVGQQLGRTTHAIHQLSYAMKKEHQNKRRKGELESQVLELHKQRLSDGQISDILNVRAETVWKVRRRLRLKANYSRGCPKGFWNRRSRCSSLQEV